MERIKIENFGGLNFVDIPIHKVNVFIGKQASGKSITAKLVYLFKGIFKEIYDGIADEKNKLEISKSILTKFKEYFPQDSWPNKDFKIVYFYNESECAIIRRQANKKIAIEYSDGVSKQFSNCRRLLKIDREKFTPKNQFEVYRPDYKVFNKYLSLVHNDLNINSGDAQIFIPAGRSFFANLQKSIFSFLSTKKEIDPFLVEFGSFYENIKWPAINFFNTVSPNIKTKAENHILEILGAKYYNDKNEDFLIHEDNRKVNLSYSSSGQQETLPLLLILRALLSIGFAGGGATVYIEEPEAHLFPSAQRKIVELIGLVINNSKGRIQIIITTHSPYILTSFNNLIHAGILYNHANTNNEKLNKIISKSMAISPEEFNAYALKNGKCENIIDEEFDLIHSSYLDKVSEEIAVEFDKLLDLT
jgi:predicted ATPase